jgi:FkbM family methyltransferase
MLQYRREVLMRGKRRFLYRYKWFVQKALMSRGYVINKVDSTSIAPIDVFDLVVRDHVARTKHFSFVQVGANDGVRFDPIHAYVKEFHWEGVLVEPVPSVFEELRANYKDEPQLRFERAAVADRDGTVPFYTIRNAPDLPEAVRGLGSLDREVILAHKARVPDIESLIEKTTVPSMTVMSLLKKYGVRKIDLLQVDTEGYDLEVLKMVDFRVVQPTIVHFEHVHLSGTDWREACRLLVGHGYRLARVGFDTVAYLQPQR